MESSPQDSKSNNPHIHKSNSNLNADTQSNSGGTNKVLENDPIVMHRHFFCLKEHDDSDFISALDFNEMFVFIGTTTGSLYKLDNVCTVSEMNSIHSTKITSILIENNDVVLSCSEKGDIQIHSLSHEFGDIKK